MGPVHAGLLVGGTEGNDLSTRERVRLGCDGVGPSERGVVLLGAPGVLLGALGVLLGVPGVLLEELKVGLGDRTADERGDRGDAGVGGTLIWVPFALDAPDELDEPRSFAEGSVAGWLVWLWILKLSSATG